MKRRLSRFLAILLAVLMMLSSMPTAFAAEPGEDPDFMPAEETEDFSPEEFAEEPEEPAEELWEAEEPEEPEDPAEPEEPSEPAALTLRAAEEAVLEDGRLLIRVYAEGGTPEALALRWGPAPGEEDEAWDAEYAELAPDEEGAYVFALETETLAAGEYRFAFSFAGDGTLQAASLPLTLEVVSDAELTEAAAEAWTLYLPAAGEPAEEPPDEPADEAADEPADEPAGEDAEEPADEPAGETAEDPVDEPALQADGAEPDGEDLVMPDSEDLGDTELDLNGAELTLDKLSYNSGLDQLSVGYSYDLEQTSTIWLIAENATTRYYLASKDYVNGSGSGTFGALSVSLEPGVYTLRVARLAGGKLRASSEGRTLRVLPRPEVTAYTPPVSATEYATVSVRVPADLSGVLALELTLDFGEADASTRFVDPADLTPGEVCTFEFPAHTLHSSRRYGLRYVASGVIEQAFAAVSSDYTEFTNSAQPGSASFEDIGFLPRVGDYLQGTTTLRYKGETAQIIVVQNTSFGEDTGLTFKSENTKVATVDAKGLVKAVGPGTCYIEVNRRTEPFDDALKLYVTVAPLSLKTFKFDRTKVTDSLSQNDLYNITVAHSIDYPTFDLRLSISEDLSTTTGANIPVTYSVTGGDGLELLKPWIPEDPDHGPTEWVTGGFEMAPAETGMTLRMRATRPGVYTVTATALGKTASCTVLIDGFTAMDENLMPTAESQFLRAGKPVTGWIREFGDEYQFGTGWKKLPKDELGDALLYYLDPKTGHPVCDGIFRIDGKLWYFQQNCLLYCYPLDTLLGLDISSNGHDDTAVFISEDASLGTGWQYWVLGVIDSGYSYFDPDTGYRLVNAWVPTRGYLAAKGLTWVNEAGKPFDEYGDTLDANVTSPGHEYEDGIHRILGADYIFIKGAVQTGWVYLSSDSENNDVYSTKSGKNDTGKYYCDPNRGGALAYGRFWAGGKEYSTWVDGCVFLPGYFVKNGLMEKANSCKYFCNKSHTPWFISDSSGALVKDAMVDALVYGGPDVLKTMYADADGVVAREQWVTVGGKSLYFDADGFRADSDVPTEWYVFSGGTALGVTASLSGEKTGYAYYPEGGGAKLTNVVIYARDSASQYYPLHVLDAKGALVGTPSLVRARMDLSDPAPDTFLIDEKGKVCRSDGAVFYPFPFKGKLYAVARDGRVNRDPGLVSLFDDTHIGWSDKNGVLTVNALQSVSLRCGSYTITRKVYFDEHGCLSSGLFQVIKGKPYLFWGWDEYGSFDDYYAEPLGGTATQVSAVAEPPTARWHLASGDTPLCFVNKDGTLKLGWVTDPNGKKHYFYLSDGGSSFTWGRYDGSTGWDTALYMIDGGRCLFDDFGCAVTGWAELPATKVIDPKDERTLERGGGLYYFDPKTGAAKTGWQTVPVPVVNGGELSYGEEKSFDNPNDRIVNASSVKAKLYFKPDGTLARSENLFIGGKLYRFEADGTSQAAEGWVNPEKTMYRLKNGQLATGRKKIDGLWYCFEETGVNAGRKVTGLLWKSGGKWYCYDENGVQCTPALSPELDEIHERRYGSTAGKDLTAVWNADGSLARVVYTANGLPAAGESVWFGSFYDGYEIDALLSGDNGYVLDAKGLPLCDTIADFTLDDMSFRLYFGVGGRPVQLGSSGENTLVQIGGTRYVMDGAEVQTQSSLRAVTVGAYASSVSDADRNTLDYYMGLWLARSYDSGIGETVSSLWVFVNPDGSVAADRAVYGTAGETTRLWHTDRFGIPTEYYSFLYRLGGKWYADLEAVRLLYEGKLVVTDYHGSESATQPLTVRTKSTGELEGFYDSRGKAVSGNFLVPNQGLGDFPMFEGGVLFLKNGKPQTGSQILEGYPDPFYLDPEAGYLPTEWL